VPLFPVGQESNLFRRPESSEIAAMMGRQGYFANTTLNSVLLNLHLDGLSVARLYVDKAWR
jgi:hypothetical protein